MEIIAFRHLSEVLWQSTLSWNHPNPNRKQSLFLSFALFITWISVWHTSTLITITESLISVRKKLLFADKRFLREHTYSPPRSDCSGGWSRWRSAFVHWDNKGWRRATAAVRSQHNICCVLVIFLGQPRDKVVEMWQVVTASFTSDDRDSMLSPA